MKISARVVQSFFILLLVFASAMISVTSAQAQTLTFDLLHTFTGSPDGISPTGAAAGELGASPFLDAKGNLFGTTSSGGDASCPGEGFGCGTVFKVDKRGQYSVLYTFLGGSDGDFPLASLTEDAAGNLYSTTNGANGNASTVFKLTQSGQKTVLHTFSGGADGGAANTTPILDAAGNLYGTTPVGGDIHCNDNGNGNACGLIYKVDAKGQFSVFHTFRKIADGFMPGGGLSMDAAGAIYGSTNYGGLMCYIAPQVGCGTVFRIESSGKFTVLHRFTGKADGAFPANVTADAAGNLYGIAGGGASTCSPTGGCGVIFKINAAGKFSVLFNFTSKIICCGFGYNLLVLDSQGNLYDTTPGNGTHNGGFLFELDKNGKFRELFQFAGQGQNGDGNFVNSIILDKHGNFYSTMELGGDFSCGNQGEGCGTVFKLKR